MKRNQILNIINELEHQNLHKECTYNDIDLWPLMRIRIASILLSNEKSTSTKNNTISFKSNIFTSLINAILGISKLFKFRQQNKHVICFGAQSHLSNLNGKLYNKFFDQLLNDFENNGKQGLIIEYMGSKINNNYYRADRVFSYKYFQSLFIITFKINKLIFLISKTKISVNNKILTKLEEYLKSESINKSLGKKELNNAYLRIKTYKNIAYLILKLLKAKESYLLCFYSEQGFGICAAANKAEVNLKEIQHGTISQTHIAYGKWKNAPKNGYNTIPKSILCWDKNSQNEIIKSGNASLFETKIIGNPWIKFLDKIPPPNIPNLKTERTILITLQPDYPLLNSFLIKEIIYDKKSNWLIKAHPRQTEDNVIKDLENSGLIINKDYINVSNYPLPLLLKISDIHITRFSGSTIEAFQMGVPTILIDKLGKLYFEDLILNNNLVLYADNSFDFNNIINEKASL